MKKNIEIDFNGISYDLRNRPVAEDKEIRSGINGQRFIHEVYQKVFGVQLPVRIWFKEVLEIADQIVELPMWGVNKSLNVMVSLGIVLYKVMEEYLP